MSGLLQLFTNAAVILIGAAAPQASAEVDDLVLCVDTRTSVVRWRGTKVGGEHSGTVRFAGGEIRVQTRSASGTAGEGEDVVVTGGELIVDMRTIDVTDIPAHEPIPRRELLSHLAHEEFFGVDRFPIASLTLRSVVPGRGRRYTVEADLAIRDSTHTVAFEASAQRLASTELRASARLVIDRRRWGVEFDGLTSLLRNALVRNEIELDIDVVAAAVRTPGGCALSVSPSPGMPPRPSADHLRGRTTVPEDATAWSLSTMPTSTQRRNADA